MSLEPGYVPLARTGELRRRAEAALTLIDGGSCRVCPRGCTVDRGADEVGLCGVGRHAVVASAFPHHGEEDCLRGWMGSGTIFFAGCNLRCVFCQNADISRGPAGRELDAAGLAELMLALEARGCHNVNWVTPEHVVPQALEGLAVAADAGLAVPLVYNTSGYESLDSLAALDGVVDVYMPDLKLMSREAARRYLRKRDYPEVATAAIREMHRQVGPLVIDDDGIARRGLLVRHLVMPGLAEESERALRWLAEELGPGTYMNVMGQYHPAGDVERGAFAEVARPTLAAEVDAARGLALELGLRLDERRPARPAAAA